MLRFLFLLGVLLVPFLASTANGASEALVVEFEVIEQGDISGCVEETYIVVRTEAEWIEVWERHTTPYNPGPQYPQVNFAESMVLCAFMGERPTAGYRISVETIWVEEEIVHVEISKGSPEKGMLVAQVLTYPYVFVLFERREGEVILHITEDGLTVDRSPLPESPTILLPFILTVIASITMIALRRRSRPRVVKYASFTYEFF